MFGKQLFCSKFLRHCCHSVQMRWATFQPSGLNIFRGFYLPVVIEIGSFLTELCQKQKDGGFFRVTVYIIVMNVVTASLADARRCVYAPLLVCMLHRVHYACLQWRIPFTKSGLGLLSPFISFLFSHLLFLTL